MVWLVKCLLNLPVHFSVTELMMYQCHYQRGGKLELLLSFETCQASKPQSIQTNLRVKQVWNSISYAWTKTLPPPEMLLPLYNFLQLHLLLTFSCFSNANLLNHFLQSLALIRTPFYSRVDCHGNYNICNIWPISYKNILRLNFPNCKDISMPQMCQPKCWN